MSLQLVLVDTVIRILSVNLKDSVDLCDSPLGSQLSTNLKVIPLITEVHDLIMINLC